jgi:peroxiredoxin
MTTRTTTLLFALFLTLSGCREASAEAPKTVGAPLGKPAPAFALPGVDGKTHKLSDFKGKVVVLEWFNPDCPFVKYAHTDGQLGDMAVKTMSDKIVWLSINSGGEGRQGHGLERNKAALEQYGMKNAILLDPKGTVGKAYGAAKTPHMFIVDRKGTLVYRGGVDNAPFGKPDKRRPTYEDGEEAVLINYVRGALDDMAAKRALRLADTPAYGCTVKYAK